MKTLSEIIARIDEIKSINLDELDSQKLHEISKELDELTQKKTELELEDRAFIAKSIANGSTGQKIEMKKENEPMETKTFTVDSQEYRKAFLKNLQGLELDATEKTAVTATAAVPTITQNKIIGILEDDALLQAIDLTAIPGNVKYPVESSVADATWTATSTDSADALTSITLNAYQLIKTVEITAQVKAMAIDAFEEWLVQRLANKIRAALVNAVVDGVGSTEPTGLNTVYASSLKTFTATGMTFADLMTIIADLPAAYHNNASFLLDREIFYTQILGMTTTDGQRVVVADAQSPAKFNILGYPVQLNDDVDFVYFGDLKTYKMNMAEQVKVDKDYSAGFRSNSVVYRGVCLADGNVADANAIVAYKQATAG